MTPAFTAKGYEKHRSMGPFVAVFPTFPTGPQGSSAFVSCDLHMSPSDARHLAAELLQAADHAEGTIDDGRTREAGELVKLTYAQARDMGCSVKEPKP